MIGRMAGDFMALPLVALVLVGMAGCGDGSADNGGGEEIGVGVVPAQVESAPAGTPQRTVLEWWRYVQVNDPEQARRLYLAPPTLPNLAGQFNFVAGRLDGTVRIASVEQRGDRASVHVRWRPENGKARRVTLRLGDDGAAWKLLDTRFLDAMVAELQRAEAG